MAYKMEHTTDDGVTHSESYWKVAETNINTVDKQGRITFNGYHSAQAKAIGKAIIDQKDYTITANDYDAFFAPSEIDPEGMNHVKAAYALALAAKEIGESPIPDEKGLLVDRRVSFFATAASV